MGTNTTRSGHGWTEASVVLPTIHHNLCTGCGDCVAACHVNALGLHQMRAMFVRPQLCDYCSDCEAVCPASAILCPFEVVFNERPSARRN